MELSLGINVSSYHTITTLAGDRDFRRLAVYTRTRDLAVVLDTLNPEAAQFVHALAHAWLKCLTPIMKGVRFEGIKVETMVEIEPAEEDGEMMKPAVGMGRR